MEKDDENKTNYAPITFLNRYESILTFQVTDIIRSKDGALGKEVTYVVCYDEAKLEITCSCRTFEFRGIICRHIVKVFIKKNIKSVPSQYILHRWRKDVRHKHSYIKNCYDDDKDGEHRVRYKNLYSQVSTAINIGVESVERYQFLMRYLEEATTKLMDISIESAENCHVNHSSDKLLIPLKVRTKGRPPSKRKVSTVEQKMNKKKRAQASRSKKDHQQVYETVQGSLKSASNLSESSTVNQFETQESLI